LIAFRDILCEHDDNEGLLLEDSNGIIWLEHRSIRPCSIKRIAFNKKSVFEVF
jgi:hypothetical protein